MIFIADQFWFDFSDEFVVAALLEGMRLLPLDFFLLEDYRDFHDIMCAYLNK